MKLLKRQKKILLKLGYDEKDFPQIEKAMSSRVTKYTMIMKNETRKLGGYKANNYLGDVKYLATIGRSAFHSTSAVECEYNNEIVRIEFDSSKLFGWEE